MRHAYSRQVPNEAADLAARLARIQLLLEQLRDVQGDTEERRALNDRINREIQLARLALLPPKP